MDKSKLLELYEDITDFIRSNIITPIRRTYESIINVFKWLPVIWGDRQWDYVYLLIIMRKKLELMSKFFKSDDAISVGSEERVREMDKCIKLLDRMIQDEYGSDCYKELDRKWGKLYFELDEGKKSFTFQRSCILNEEDREQERLDILNCVSVEENERLADYDKLFKLMNRQVRGWWD